MNDVSVLLWLDCTFSSVYFDSDVTSGLNVDLNGEDENATCFLGFCGDTVAAVGSGYTMSCFCGLGIWAFTGDFIIDLSCFVGDKGAKSSTKPTFFFEPRVALAGDE